MISEAPCKEVNLLHSKNVLFLWRHTRCCNHILVFCIIHFTAWVKYTLKYTFQKALPTEYPLPQNDTDSQNSPITEQTMDPGAYKYRFFMRLFYILTLSALFKIIYSERLRDTFILGRLYHIL